MPIRTRSGYIIPFMIPTPTIKEILVEDFEADLDRIDTDTEIDIEASRKLAEYFGVSEMFFYNLQQDIHARKFHQGHISSSNA